MRLIDGKELADELLGKIFERGQASGIWEEQLEIGAITYKDIEFADGYDHALDDIYRRIEEQPTIKAIPIEWIKTVWLKREDYTGTIEFFPQPSFEEVMGWLIEDWEKENGRSK